MNTQHASITARIEALDSQYSQAQQIYKLYDRMLRLELTPHDLTLLPDTQLTEYQKSLIVHMDTPNEQKARQVNRMINDEKHRRSGYGD